jgi:hypothetical protein
MPILNADDRRTAWSVAGIATTLSDTLDPLKLSFARAWQLVVSNGHGSQTITALRLRFRNRGGGTWGPWETVTLAAPIAAGASLRVQPSADGECSYEMDVEATASGAATPVSLDVVGV